MLSVVFVPDQRNLHFILRNRLDLCFKGASLPAFIEALQHSEPARRTQPVSMYHLSLFQFAMDMIYVAALTLCCQKIPQTVDNLYST